MTQLYMKQKNPSQTISILLEQKKQKSAPFLPTNHKEKLQLGWDYCDIIIITGDAYVDHPGFGCAIIGRVLESQGFRVGIIPQPNWHKAESFKVLGKPRLFFGITAGNMDSMVNHYTSERHVRDKDAYSPNGQMGLRPNRASIVYSHKCREAYPDCKIFLGGIECGLRRFAHYDFWQDKIRRSILFDSKADCLIYGNAERAIVHLAKLLSTNQPPDYYNIDGIAYICNNLTENCYIQDFSNTESIKPDLNQKDSIIQIPSFESIEKQPGKLSKATLLSYMASKNGAPPLVQEHGNRFLRVNAPKPPLSTQEMDFVYNLPYSRLPHPMYKNKIIPAFEMIKDSITLMRGCFGGCSFCSISMHEGRIIQSRSVASVVQEIRDIKKKNPYFSGYISDLGGPTANMYMMGCKRRDKYLECKRLSCLFPNICHHLNTNHQPLINLYKKIRQINEIKGAWVSSGVRYDLALKSPEYINVLAKYHVSGYLKIAPEHSEDSCLKLMMKPGIDQYDTFEQFFQKASQKARKKQYIVPYMLCAHPGTDHRHMVALALWLKKRELKLDQVQIFLPTPLTLSTGMYVSGNHFYHQNRRISVPKGGRARSLQKKIIRYHDSKNWPDIRKVLHQLKLSRYIGYGDNCLVPKGHKKH